jgi:hypothetical protein
VGGVEAELGAEAGELGAPIGEQRGGHDDQVRTRLPLALEEEQQADHLDGLAEAHVVGEAAAEAEANEQPQPRDALALVGAELAVQGLSGVSVGAAGWALELAEGAREPGAGLRDGPLGGVVGVGVAVTSHAGDEAHALNKADGAAGGAGLDPLPVAVCVAVIGGIEVDPAASHVAQARAAAHKHPPLLRGELVVADEVAELEVEQGAEAEHGRGAAADLRADLRARALSLPPPGDVEGDAEGLEVGRVAEEFVGLLGGPGDGVEELVAVEELADPRDLGGGAAQRGEQELLGGGIAGPRADRRGEGAVLDLTARAAAGADGGQEGEGARFVALALGEVEVEAIAIGIDAVEAAVVVEVDARGAQRLAGGDLDLLPRGGDAGLREAGAAEAVRGAGEQGEELARGGGHAVGGGLGDAGEGGAGEAAAPVELGREGPLALRGEEQEAKAEAGLADVGLPDPQRGQ